MTINTTGAGHGAFTVTPNVSYSETGEEIIDYDNAFVYDNTNRQQVIEDFNNNNTQYINEDSMGNHHHAYELDEEQSLQYSDDNQEELTSDDFIVEDLPMEEVSFIKNQVGGEQAYAELMEWAESNIHPDDVDAFNQIAETGTTEEILEMLSSLYSVYAEHFDDTYSDDDYSSDEYQAAVEQEIEELQRADPEGTELALEQLQEAYDLQESDPEASIVLQASAAFHRNDLSAEDAINMVIDQLGYEAAIEVYQRLTNWH